MACIYLLNSCGGARSFDFVITTYSYPLTITRNLQDEWYWATSLARVLRLRRHRISCQETHFLKEEEDQDQDQEQEQRKTVRGRHREPRLKRLPEAAAELKTTNHRKYNITNHRKYEITNYRKYDITNYRKYEITNYKFTALDYSSLTTLFLAYGNDNLSISC